MSSDPHDRAWIESTIGASILDVTPLAGGMSSVMSMFDFSDGTRVVLRQVDDADWFSREPDLLVRESKALQLMQASDVPTPELIAVDTDRGMLLMTWLPGRMVFDPAGLTDRIQRIGQVAADIAAVPVPADHGLPPWTSWVEDDLVPPAWGDPTMWGQAIDRHEQGTRSSSDVSLVLLHRDLHPLNMLWHGGDVGVVDWVNACIGPRDAELAHLRWNLAVLVGLDAADAATQAYLTAAGVTGYDRWWDLTTVLSLLPGPIGHSGWSSVGLQLSNEHVVRATEDFIAAALDAI